MIRASDDDDGDWIRRGQNFAQGSVRGMTAVIEQTEQETNVLDAGLPFVVHSAWKIPAVAAVLLGGQWTVTVYAEAIGHGADLRVASVVVPLDGSTDYQADVTIPAGALSAGVYKLTTVLTHRNFGRISDVAGVVEGPVVRVA